MAEWIPSPNFYSGRPYGIRAIVIHWWSDPAQRPQINGIIAHFQNAASQVSAHYVVGQGRTVQMVNEGNQAWHARQANTDTIGIEVDPNADENTYRLVGQLVADIRSRRGNLPLEKHSQHVATACPGHIDLNKINSYASGGGDEVIKAEDRDLVRIVNSEVAGWDFNKVHTGVYDNQEMTAWIGQPWTKFIKEKWEGSDAFRKKRTELFASNGNVTKEAVIRYINEKLT